MKGKYASARLYWSARVKRGLLRVALRRLVCWRTMADPQPGYTLIVACHAPLAEMVLPSIELLARQDLTNLRKLIIAFDRPENAHLLQLIDDITHKYPQLRCDFLFQGKHESRLLRRVGWGWVDCWLSYARGIARCDTRYALLHDMDAMLIRRDLIEERYRLIRERGDHFMGIRWYKGNGIIAADKLAYIVEMALDAEFVRRECRPLDLFNVIGRIDGRTVDFDTLLYPQTRTERRSIANIDIEEMVHPSQVVSQYTMLDRPNYVPPPTNNALFIPYFYYLAGQRMHLEAVRDGLDGGGMRVPLLAKSMDVSKLSVVHAQWLFEQAMRIERAFVAEPRLSVVSYFESICRFAGARVGQIETGAETSPPHVRHPEPASHGHISMAHLQRAPHRAHH